MASELVRFFELDFNADDEHISTVIDVSGSVDAKMDAVKCHRTQLDFPSLTREQAHEVLSREHFWLAYPPVPPGVQETDLFQGAGTPAPASGGGVL